MARPRSELSVILHTIPGVEGIYFQKPTTLEYPAIVYDIDDEYDSRADNLRYFLKKRYTVTVIDRNPDSLIPDVVGALPYSRFDRKYVVNNLHHTVYQLYF